jgi:hypothetical protein
VFKTEHPVPTRIQFQYFSFLLVMLHISGSAAEFLKQKIFNLRVWWIASVDVVGRERASVDVVS